MICPFEPSESLLQVYLLGTVDFDAMLRLQRRLHYDVTGDPNQAVLVVCEHPPMITMGRHASRSHVKIDPQSCPVRWVGRGGGCWLHRPGQLSVYPIFPLERLGLTVPAYLDRLANSLAGVFGDFSVRQRYRADDAGVWFGNRLGAALGVGVRHSVTSFGAILNVCPDLEFFRGIQCHPNGHEPMTSLERERHGPIRMAMVRERLVHHFVQTFGFTPPTVFTEHPLLQQKPTPSKAQGRPSLGLLPAQPYNDSQ